MRISHVVVVVITLLARSGPALADKATATAAYNEGKRLMKEGKAAEACPKFETSYREDPQLGVLLNLADCHEVTKRLATAWVEFGEAAEVAAKIGDARETYAKQRADALLPKLAKLKVLSTSAPVQGMVVRRDGVDITSLVGDELPVDPGDYTVTAEAPGYALWSLTVTVADEAKVVEVQIPALTSTKVEPVPEPNPEPKPEPKPAPERVVIAPPHDTKPTPAPRTASRSKALPLALTVGSVALLGGAAGFSLWGDSIYADAESESDDDRQLDLWHQADTRRYVAEGLLVGGVVCGAVAVWAWLRHPDEHRASDETVVDASVASDSALVTVRGAW